MIIEGNSIVEWVLSDGGDKHIAVKDHWYHVPECKACLIIPQCIFKCSKGVTSQFCIEEDHSTLTCDMLNPLNIDYDSRKWLHIATTMSISIDATFNICIISKDNHNLLPSKKSSSLAL